MKHVVVFLTLSALFLFVFIALAQSDYSYDLTWKSIDGGGHTFSTGGDYSMGGTIGQPDATVLTGGDYTLGGGFWIGGTIEYKTYLPLIQRNEQ